MTNVEALHELRRMAQPTCWRCEGSGKVRCYWDRPTGVMAATFTLVPCPSCAGTGQPERVA